MEAIKFLFLSHSLNNWKEDKMYYIIFCLIILILNLWLKT